MGQTFRAICPAASTLHVFELVSEKGRTVGWCTKCRQTWPLSELSDRKDDDPAPSDAPRGRPKKRRRKTVGKAQA
ncbi:MAG TPA: hypothetical protein VN809_06875 [Telmatospirillum sp.]|nr:hypothetical protein [Telmatospirillum sp.]